MYPREAGSLPWQRVKAFRSWLLPCFGRGMLSAASTSLANQTVAGWLSVAHQPEQFTTGSSLAEGLQELLASLPAERWRCSKGLKLMEIQVVSQCSREGIAVLCQPRPPGYRLCCFWESKGRKFGLKMKGERN